jgi:predicted lipid carrier protein YhbT
MDAIHCYRGKASADFIWFIYAVMVGGDKELGMVENAIAPPLGQLLITIPL